MKILITTHHLKNRAGSELFTFDLVMEFKKRGHDVFVFSNILGKVSEEIERSGGIPVTNNLSDFVNENIDIIHAQHNTTAMMARSVFPNTPMVFMSHGILPDLEQPPTENLNILNIFKYLVVSNEAKDHLTKKYGISKDQIKIVRSFIDTNKFFPKKEVNLFPKKLLVVSNHYRKNTKEIIESACKELGIEVTHVGLPNNSVENVEDFINDSDI
ncbi:MAG: glycosyltransferase, partial [Candidatus Moranbacteria bacterium]|nr:glycosyltransferase [Candidatus Moranbacteria bacterium]